MLDINSHVLTVSVFVSALLVSSLTLSVVEQEFVREPADQTVVIEHGDTGYFYLYCTVTTLEADQRVSWFIGDIIFADNTDFRDYSPFVIDESRYFLITLDDSIGSALVVHPVTAATAALDRGPFKCAITTTSSYIVKTSNVAVVTIYEVPRLGHPLCRMSDPFDENIATENLITLREGDTYTFTCLSDPGYPTVTMSCSRNDVSGSLQEYQWAINDNGLLFLTYLWTPSRLDSSGLNFTCTVGHPGLLQDRTCTIGEFDVQYTPTVEISSTRTHVTSLTDTILFTCTSDSNPAVNQINWLYNNESISPGNVSRFHFQGLSMEISLFDDQENGVHYVRCELTNTVGTGSAGTSFVVDIPPVTTALPTTTDSTTVGELEPTSSTTVTKYAGDLAPAAQQQDGVIIGGATAGVLVVLLIVIIVLVVVIVMKRRNSRPSKSPEQPDVKSDEYAEIGQSGDNVTSSYATVNVAFKSETDGVFAAASVDIQLKAQVATKKGDLNKNISSGNESTTDGPDKGKVTELENVEDPLTYDAVAESKDSIQSEVSKGFDNKEDKKKKKPDIKPKPKQTKRRRNTRDTSEYSAYENVGPMTGQSVGDVTNNDQSESETRRKQQFPSNNVYEEVHGSFDKPAEELTHSEEQGTVVSPNDPRSKNVEGLTYADLDLSNVTPRNTTKQPIKEDDAVVYADLQV